MAWLVGSAASSAGGLVGAGGVDVEVADEFVVGEDRGVAPVEDDGDLAAGPVSADADVEFVELDDPVGVDGHGVGSGSRGGMWERLVRRLRGGAGLPALERGDASDALMRALLVVVAAELLEAGLQLDETAGEAVAVVLAA